MDLGSESLRLLQHWGESILIEETFDLPSLQLELTTNHLKKQMID